MRRVIQPTIIQHTILTSRRTKKSRPAIQLRPTRLDNQREGIIGGCPSRCFFPTLTADRIPANTCRLDLASEGLCHEFSPSLWPAHPPEFWPHWFLRTPRATLLPAPRLQVPRFFRWRPPRCIQVRCNRRKARCSREDQ